MLITFTAKNFKSFKNEFTFSMMPAPKQKGLDCSLLTEKIGAKKCKVLCSSVIYGLNASGKTNVIEAMETFKSIILRGNIRNNDDKTFHTAGNMLELIPNNSRREKRPLEFSIKFIEDGILFEYSLLIDIGPFLDTYYKRKILMEKLSINGKLIFDRENILDFGNFKAIREYLIKGFEENRNGAVSIAKNSLDEEELFLMNGFKTMFSLKLVNIITDWLENKFIIVYKNDSLHLIKKYLDSSEQAEYMGKGIRDLVKIFGVNPNTLEYIPSDDDSESRLCSVFEGMDKSSAISADLFESYGTIKFVNMLPLILSTLQNGATLVIDEFDASLHPVVIINIINIFHNKHINIKNAQLIFNTHNPIFLNSHIFRRDEVKFVKRNNETSTQYTLSDFGTAGQKGVRKNEDYMKNYFSNEYGAIKNIDFAPILENIMKSYKKI